MTYSLRICDLPLQDRPRERLIESGVRALSTAELLAILISTGSGSCSALDLAQQILKELSQGGQSHFDAMRDLAPAHLYGISGVGPAKAATICAAIELGQRVYLARPNERPQIDGPEAAHLLLQSDLAYARQEKFAVMLLDIKNRVLATQVISVGTIDETLAHPREVFREAIRQSAAGILVAHNHPSGDTTPSPEDLHLTRRLIQAGRLLGIRLLDHLVIAGASFTSIARSTRLWQEIGTED